MQNNSFTTLASPYGPKDLTNPFERHDARLESEPFYAKRLDLKMVHCSNRAVLPWYPRDIGYRSPESLFGTWRFELGWPKQLSGGSKLRCYRRARGIVACARRYGRIDNFYFMFAGPKGILP